LTFRTADFDAPRVGMEPTYRRGVLDRPDVLQLFAGQFGVASTEQLDALGVAKRTLARARERGVIRAVLPGVTELAEFPPTFRQRCMAAQLFGGDRCFLDGHTAGHLYGLRGMWLRLIQLVTASRRRGQLPDWLKVTFSTWIDLDDVVVRDDGLRIARPPRMLLSLATWLDDRRFERAAEDAWHLDLITPAQAAVYLDQIAGKGRPGVARFARWVERSVGHARPAHSGLELEVAAAAVAAGLPEPVRQHPLRLADGVLIHLDLAWPDLMLGIEPGHSWWHGGARGQRAEQQRKRACAAVGWHVECYDESAARNLEAVGAEIAEIYRQRAKRFRPS
jgi:hypothetical protein